MKEVLLIIDFGSQYTQLIARRVRELNVCSQIVPFNKFKGLEDNVKGLFGGGNDLDGKRDPLEKEE